MKSANVIICHILFLCLTACGGGSGSSNTVPVATLSSITVTPATPTIPLGNSGQFTATGTYSDASTRDLTALATWSSSAPSIATVSNTGGANGSVVTLATGSCVITAAMDGVSGSTTLNVSAAATLVSITVTPSNPSTPLGIPVQLSAIGHYSNSTTNDITATASWSSSATGTATVGNSVGIKGLVTPVGVGTTTITATSGSASGSTQLTVTPGSSSGVNVMTVSVNGSLCSANSNVNKACVSVRICTPGTSTCQTISDILLDTGSFGLRLFNQLISVPLTQTTVGGNPLAECIQFAGGTADWGPVKLADVILGGEPAVTVPIQVIDSTFATVPAACGIPEAGPDDAGFNGILGVGPSIADCGSTCVNGANNGVYYSCGASCKGSKVPLANQVQNPVALLPQDNNGMIVQLPSVPAGGAPSVTGQLVLGINTRSNNIPSGANVYPVDSTGNFTTIFNGTPDSNSFIDSGSNGLFFYSFRTIPECSGTYAGWFCPATTLNLTATNHGIGSSPSVPVAFQIGNADALLSSTNYVFTELGGTSISGSGFDWGLPFFLGRSVYVGISGKSSSLGSGPYWAY